MRVVGGEARGRRLQAPAGRTTRPTSDEVREAVLNMVTSRLDLDGARCVDLFAGSGAYGIEALSRGAAEVTFVDDDAKAVACIKENLAALGLEGGVVVRADAIGWLRQSQPKGTLDLAFVDPPYAFERWGEVLEALDVTFAACESDRSLTLGEGWGLVRERRAGDTVVSVIRPVLGQGAAG